MNSREIVARTLAFEAPQRVAQSFAPSDLVSAGAVFNNPAGEWRRLGGNAWERTDEWGNTWGRVDDTSKGEIVRGAVPDLAAAATTPLPDFGDSALYSQAASIFAAAPDKWHIGFVQGFTFKMAQCLRKLDQYLCDLIADQERLAILHDRVDEQIAAQIHHLHEAGADCIMIAEDWGTQGSMMISPRLWKEEFKPRFARLCSIAHDQHMHVFMHSCGKMTAIIPDLIEAGIDLFQFDQPRIHGLETLMAFQDSARVSFWSPVDIQTVLQSKDESTIRQEARDMLDKLWRRRGGFIAGYYADNPSIGLEPVWQEIACDEFRTRGRR